MSEYTEPIAEKRTIADYHVTRESGSGCPEGTAERTTSRSSIRKSTTESASTAVLPREVVTDE